MTRFIILRLATIVASWTVLAFTHAADAAELPEAEKPVQALIAALSEAFAKLDAHAFSMVFHEDADFTNVWGMTAHGRKAIEEFHRPLLEGDGSGPIPSFKHAETKVLDARIRFLRPDVTVVDATWSHRSGAKRPGHGVSQGLANAGGNKGAGRLGHCCDA